MVPGTPPMVTPARPYGEYTDTSSGSAPGGVPGARGLSITVDGRPDAGTALRSVTVSRARTAPVVGSTVTWSVIDWWM